MHRKGNWKICTEKEAEQCIISSTYVHDIVHSLRGRGVSDRDGAEFSSFEGLLPARQRHMKKQTKV